MHHHAHGTGWVLRLSLAATLTFTVFEVWAGLRAHSLALLSDAGHNFTDALALLLAAIGIYLQSKPADQARTYGYHRAGVLTAFVNALTLVIISLFIFWEAGTAFHSARSCERSDHDCGFDCGVGGECRNHGWRSTADKNTTLTSGLLSSTWPGMR